MTELKSGMPASNIDTIASIAARDLLYHSLHRQHLSVSFGYEEAEYHSVSVIEYPNQWFPYDLGLLKGASAYDDAIDADLIGGSISRYMIGIRANKTFRKSFTYWHSNYPSSGYYLDAEYVATWSKIPSAGPKIIPNTDREPHRLTGPVLFLKKLLKTWRLSRRDATCLLGLEANSGTVDDLLNGRIQLRGRDVEDRVAYLFRIRKTLFALFRNEEVENEWLREKHDALAERSPMDCLLEGSMENLLLVKEYVEVAAGR